jgi:Spy/CpxP family protein refolding chaperone
LTPNLTPRCFADTRFRLLATSALGLGLLLSGHAVATAQRPAGSMHNPQGVSQGNGSLQQGNGRMQQGNGSMQQGNGGMSRGTRNGSRDRAFGSSLVPPARAPHTGLQLGLGGRWWDDHKTVKELNLRPGQQQRMDGIFESNRATLVTLYSNLQLEQAHLAAIPPGNAQDESKVFASIDRVAQARTDLEKENVHMLLLIRQQLDPAQVQSLDAQISKQQ